MYSGSEVVSRDMDSLLFSSNFKYSSPGEFAKSKEMINSDLYYYNNSNNHHLEQQPPPPRHQQQQSSNLVRYRSAPSSFVSGLLNDDYPNRETSNFESEMMFPRFNDSNEYKVGINLKQEMEELVADYSVTEMVYATPALNHSSPASANSLSGLNSSIEMESLNQVKKSSGGNRSNLIRQSSSPAGFLSNLANENGFGVTSDVGNFRATNRTIMNKYGPAPRSRFMPQIIESENREMSNHQNGHLGNEQNGDDSNRHYFPVMPNDSTFSTLKRNRDGEVNMFSNSNGFNTQNGDSKHYTSGLLHQMSLPSTSAEMSTIENLLHFQQDSVPFKIRAKRGFATHPRSIAERMRRTRISERMKKLQDLFPNMDKQANTADMLDLAVGYIKDLQKEVQTLNETRARCTCSSKR